MSGQSSALVIGRDPGCDLVLDHPTISTRHARLVLTHAGLVLEDLGSTNGTFLDDALVQRARIERGANVRLGDVILPWSDPRVVAFTKRFSARGTMVMGQVAARMRGGGAKGGVSAKKGLGRVLGFGVGLVTVVAILGVVFALAGPYRTTSIPIPGTDASIVDHPADESIEGIIRRTRAPGIAAAIDATNAVTRDTAVKIAAGEEGPFHVEQVARIWTYVRGRWRYVNDPNGAEYFAKASETIANEYAGDCDDFATLLAAMVTAVGGEARVIVMNSAEGGHAYTEACIRMDATEVSSRLGRYYRRKWDPYLGRQRVDRIHYRTDAACPLWLNLDWSAGVPGGPYANEEWAVAVSANGSTETLAPGRADPQVPTASAR